MSRKIPAKGSALRSPIVAVDLFAGAGGMSLGASMAGVDVRLAVEIDPCAASTYRLNHPQTPVFQRDIRLLNVSDLPQKKRMKTILFGGPPCQGFSTSNQKTRSTNNESNWLFQEYLRVVQAWMPDWVVFENVTGLVQTAEGLFLDSVQSGLKALDYRLSTWTLNASEFGVPQRRSRLFIVGSRAGFEIPAPVAISSSPVTVREAIGDLPRLHNGESATVLPYGKEPHSQYAEHMRRSSSVSLNNFVTRNAAHIVARYPHIPQGGNWESIPSRLMRNYKDRTRCHTGIYHRLRASEPSVVIGNYRKNMLIHPTQNRGLSVREAARLQSFPDHYSFAGSIGFQQQQVGNAVPPLLAEVVFAAIHKTLDIS